MRIEQEPDRDDRVGRASEELERAEPDERAHHEDVAVGEVQELEDPVDERVAERDERVDAAEREAVERQLGERVHAERESIRHRKWSGPASSRAAPVVRLSV